MHEQYWIQKLKEKHNFFSVILPLKHLFGFCEKYRKVIYGLQHTPILRHNYDDKVIIKTDDKKNDVDKLEDRKV